MRMRALILAAAAGIAAASALHAQTAPPEPDPTTEPDTLTFERRGNLMAVAVTVTGQGPYAFLVDSGAERTVISRELAKLLALAPGKSVRVHSMTEASTISTAKIPHLQFSRRRVNDIQAPSLPAAYIGAAGVLGVDSLRRQLVEFDFAKRTMSVSASRTVAMESAPNAIVVTAKNMYGRLVITNVLIDGQSVIAVIDTGSDLTVGNRALQAKLAKRNRLQPTVPLLVASITGHRFTVDYTHVKRMAVRDLTVSNMPIGFTEAHIFQQLHLQDKPAVMLGMDTLRLFAKVSVDFARKEVRFELPNASGNGALASAD